MQVPPRKPARPGRVAAAAPSRRNIGGRMTTSAKRKQCAEQLAAYLACRAEREGVAMTLTPDWLEGGLRHGCRGFFGIEVRNWRLVRDRQEPEPGFFKAWAERAVN